MTSSIISTNADSEIVTTRTVNASIELVFRAWTDPIHLQNWWGPKGFTNTFNEFDFRPGGKWRFMMHGPDKGNYLNECAFIQIYKPTLIAWNHLSNPVFQVVVHFNALSLDKTEIIFKMLFNSAEECAKVKVFAVDKNEENLDKLEAELLTMN